MVENIETKCKYTCVIYFRNKKIEEIKTPDA